MWDKVEKQRIEKLKAEINNLPENIKQERKSLSDEEEEPIYINMDTIRFFTINPRIIYENGKKVLMVEKIKVKKDE